VKIYNILGMLTLGCICAGCVLQKHAVSTGASGIVMDSQTHSPLPGASVSVPPYKGKAQAITTGEDGLFSIQAVLRRDPVFIIMGGDFRPPSNTLVVSRAGFVSTNIDLWTVRTNFVEVLLAPATK